MDVLDDFMSRHSSTSKGIMSVDKNLSDQQKKEEGLLLDAWQ